jgi:hypothetical protein
MLRKKTYERSVVTDGWLSVNSVDGGVIERLFKKEIREGEALHAGRAGKCH